jgi:hypothetical protein
MIRNRATTENKNLSKVESIARLMDSKFTVPGTRFKFGLDPILGLIPVVGDAASLAISGGLIMYMIRFGASRKVATLMLINVILDATIGSIPVVGAIFDFFYKANTRNIRLLKAHYEEGKYQGGATGILIVVGVVTLALMALIIWGLWEVADWALQAITNS